MQPRARRAGARALPRPCSSGARASPRRRAAARRLPARSTSCPQALAAVDMALWDRAGPARGTPAGGARCASDPAGRVPVNATRHGARTARAPPSRPPPRRAAGSACLKVKVGVGDDAGRLAAVRAAAGPHVALRLDANGAWSVSEAVAAIGALDPVGLELVEEPTHGLAGVRAVRERGAGARGDRRDRGRARRARRGRRRRGVPEDLALRRHRGPARGGRARARLRRRGLPRLEPRRAAGRRRRACTPPPRWLARAARRTAAWRRWRCSRTSRTRCRRATARSRVPVAPGLGVAPFGRLRRPASDALAASTARQRAPGLSSASAWPPASTCSRASGISSASRRADRARTSRRARRRRRSTGIVSSPSRPHSGSISPVPSPRSAAASAPGLLRRWSSRASSPTSGGSSANSGWVRQRSMNSSNGLVSSSLGERWSAARRCCALAGVLDPGGAGHEHQPLRRARARRARRAGRCARPASSRTARSARGCARARCSTQPAKRDRPLAPRRRSPWPGQVERQRA